VYWNIFGLRGWLGLALNAKKIEKMLASIAQCDPHVAKALNSIGCPAARIRPQGFETFLTTLISQQISKQAAETITGRVLALMPQVAPGVFLGLPIELLREAGMSMRKIEYTRELAKAISSGEFLPERLETMSDTEAIEHIVKLRGFGVWSAEIYLMFSLGREDIFPADDLIIRIALKKLKKKRVDLTPKHARELVQHWSPYRSAGSLFLWHMHHKGLTMSRSAR